MADLSTSVQIQAAVDIIKRTRPEKVGLVLKSLLILLKQSSNVSLDELSKFIASVPIIAKPIKCDIGEYLGVSQNSNGKLYRAPGTNTYNGPKTSSNQNLNINLNDEGILNNLFGFYAKQYTSMKSDCLSSLYLKQGDPKSLKGVGILLITPPSSKMTGRYQSTCNFSVDSANEKKIESKTTSTITLFLKTKDEEKKFDMNLMGNYTVSKSTTLKSKDTIFPDLCSSMEKIESDALSEIKNVYFKRMKYLILKFRSEIQVEILNIQKMKSKEFLEKAALAAKNEGKHILG